MQGKRTLLQFSLVDVVKHNLCVEALSMTLHAFHQSRSLQSFHIPWPVVDIRGCGQLTALNHASDHQGREVGASRVNGCGVSSGSGAQDDQAMMLLVGHNVEFLHGFWKSLRLYIYGDWHSDYQGFECAMLRAIWQWVFLEQE